MIHIWIKKKCNGFTPHQSRENNRLLLPCQQVQVSVNVGGGLVVGVDFPVERGVLSRFLWDYSHHHQTANTITRKWQFHELWPLNLIQCMLVHNYKSMFFINFKIAIISRNYNFQIQYKTYRLIITKIYINSFQNYSVVYFSDVFNFATPTWGPFSSWLESSSSSSSSSSASSSFSTSFFTLTASEWEPPSNFPWLRVRLSSDCDVLGVSMRRDLNARPVLVEGWGDSIETSFSAVSTSLLDFLPLKKNYVIMWNIKISQVLHLYKCNNSRISVIIH